MKVALGEGSVRHNRDVKLLNKYPFRRESESLVILERSTSEVRLLNPLV